jgi:hypothetical protein
MNERGITDALTSDHHFEQAGFQILLKSTPYIYEQFSRQRVFRPSHVQKLTVRAGFRKP